MSNIFKLVTHIDGRPIGSKKESEKPDGYHKKAVEYRKKMMAQKLSPSGKVILKKNRMLTPAESAEKMKDWPKGPEKQLNESEKRAWQQKHKRAYSD